MLPQVTSVAALLASNASIPRVNLFRVQLHDASDNVRLTDYVSDAPFVTPQGASSLPGVSFDTAFKPRVLDLPSIDWSRVSGDAVTGYGRSVTSRATMTISNDDSSLDSWADHDVRTGVLTWWVGTWPQYGLKFDRIVATPQEVLRIRDVRSEGRTLVVELQDVTGLLEGKRIRRDTDRYLGLGNAVFLPTVSSGKAPRIEFSHDAALNPTSYCFDSAICRFDATASRVEVVACKGDLASAQRVLYRDSNGEVVARVYVAGGASFVEARSSAVIAAERIVALGIEVLWSGASLDRLRVRIDGQIEADVDASTITFQSADASPLTFGGQADPLDSIRGWITDLRSFVNTTPLTSDEHADIALRQIALTETLQPTLYAECNEGIGDTAYARPPSTAEGELKGGSTWVPTLTGDAELRDVYFPTLIGRVGRADARVLSRRFRWREVHAGAVFGIGPADAGGSPLLIRWAEPRVSTAVSINATTQMLTVGAGDPVDLEGLSAGRRVRLTSTTSVDDGVYRLAVDSERFTLQFADDVVLTGGTPATYGTMTIETAGEVFASSAIEFQASRGSLNHAGSIPAPSKYVGDATVVLGGTVSNNGGVTVLSATGDLLEVSGVVTAEPAGRAVTLARTLTYGASEVGFNNAGSWIALNSAAPPTAAPLDDVAVGSTLQCTVAPNPALLVTYTVTRIINGGVAVTPAPAVTLNPAAGAVTLVATETSTSVEIATRPQRIVSHDDQIEFLGWQEGGSFVVTGSTSNNGTFTIASGSTLTELRTEESIVDESAGASVVITADDATVWDVEVYPSKGRYRLSFDPVRPVAVAVRGAVFADGRFEEVGGGLFELVTGELAGLSPDRIDFNSLSEWKLEDSQPKGLQWLEPPETLEALDDLVQPTADYGAKRGTFSIEARLFATVDRGAPPAEDLSILRQDHFGASGVSIVERASSGPVRGVRNYVVLEEDEIPSAILSTMPELVERLRREWIEVDGAYGTADARQDEPVPSAYASVEGVRAAAKIRSALFGSDRQVLDVDLPAAVRALNWRTVAVKLVDPDVPGAATGRIYRILRVRLGSSELKNPSSLWG